MEKVFFILICMLVFDLLPSLALAFGIKAITKKKLSKGWCISAFVLSTLITFILTMLYFGKPIKIGIFDYMIHFIVIKSVLYDKDADSFLDSEKEILRKRELKK